MTPRPNTIDDLQRWTLAAITAEEPPRTDDLNSTILSSRQQSAADRLAVYRHAYIARLQGVLRDLFPCTRYACGDDLFDQFCVGYLRQHPPSSYTLARLADQLPEHLEATRPADWGAFVVELARLEQAIDRVFDAPGPENLPPFFLPAFADNSLRVSLVPGFTLLAFEFPVSTYYTNWKAGQSPSWPEPRQQFVALLRRNYVVRRYELSAPQHRLLSALHVGTSLGEALCDVANADCEAADLESWFSFWASEQFFAAVH